MTNPDNTVGTNAGYNGRTTPNAFNDILGAFSRGLISGWACSPKSGMTVQIGGDGTTRDVAIAEDNAGNRLTINNRTATPIDITISGAPATGNRIDLIVAYAENPPTGSGATSVDFPDAVGIIAVSGTAAGTPSDPDENDIRTAITADGATGATAYYVILAKITVGQGVTTIGSGVIEAGPFAQISTDIVDPTPADGSITSAKLATNAVTTAKIADGAVTTAKLADDAVGWKYLGFVHTETTTDHFDFVLPETCDNYKIIAQAEITGSASTNAWITLSSFRNSTIQNYSGFLETVVGTTWGCGAQSNVDYIAQNNTNPYYSVYIQAVCLRGRGAENRNWVSMSVSGGGNTNGKTTRGNMHAASSAEPELFRLRMGGNFIRSASIFVWGMNNS